jgi:cyclase
MTLPRVIPCLQLVGDGLVKATRFRKPAYIGDPVNTVRIFNELEVDELCFLDIRATVNGRPPNLKVLREIANECFMPLSYGGAIRDLDTARDILGIGFEKIVVGSMAVEQPEFVSALAREFGSQAVVCVVDARQRLFGHYRVHSHDGTKKQPFGPAEWARRLADLGAGELLVTSMDREGTWNGFDLALTRDVSEAVNVPVIAHGGAGSIAHIAAAVAAGASAVALGSMVVFQGPGMGVLVNFPDRTELTAALTAAVKER